MKLQKIDKDRYRKHLNMASVIAIAILIILSLVYAQVLIHFFADDESSNFKLNLLGVILGIISLIPLFNQVRSHPYLAEVMYVWDLKQVTNQIYRKLHKIKATLADTNIDAIIILNYYYAASQQLYVLDNNTLTLTTLQTDMATLQTLIESKNLSIDTDNYRAELLHKF
jgi:hypothetical protein